jgi:DNA polymerase sigma
MCLQVPSGRVVTSEEDPTGAIAMSKLAQALQDGGMKDVDTARLTARIPVIKFNCPAMLLDRGIDGEAAFMECDLSMHNPLAVLNTSLLRTYAEITPVTRVLAAIVKRWAKARDINNPARHTLSSYGYLIMLLHFLTYHHRTGNGLVSSFSGTDGVPTPDPSASLPLLPNLQWVDETWAQGPPGLPYRELGDRPKKLMKHPQDEKSVVNAHFYRPANAVEMGSLQRLFPGQDLSLAILLASFFRYYAYDFDYKRHVVSLHSTISHGLIEREVKAELDGWRNYSAALTIEDPFETFYDVAHVLRGGYYHRIRREFALAFTKIACIAEGTTDISWSSNDIKPESMTGMDLVDWICEIVSGDTETLS